MRAWKSLGELFSGIPRKMEYLVLRNYEAFENEQMLSEHSDIDVLTADVDGFVRLVGAEPRKLKDDHIHYKISVAGSSIPLDIRTPGDGYYDEKWAKDLLANRQMYQDVYYVPEPKMYFYSLLYHAIAQKRSLSNDYKERLKQMADSLGISCPSASYCDVLNTYMRDHGYMYTYPKYLYGIANFEKADPKLIQRDRGLMILRHMAQSKRKIGSFVKRRWQRWVKN